MSVVFSRSQIALQGNVLDMLIASILVAQTHNGSVLNLLGGVLDLVFVHNK